MAGTYQQIIGQLGIDFRVMRLNENAVNVFGLIDLCVDREFRAKGLAKALLAEFERIARTGSYKVDFLFLVSDSRVL
ncbi:MAG: GNAT family N-acetyltransferase [Chitinophagales bacterium]